MNVLHIVQIIPAPIKGGPAYPNAPLVVPPVDLHHLSGMKRKRRSPRSLPLLVTELALASFETVCRRASMMADGSCTPQEYRRMVFEKALAARRSGRAIAAGRVHPTQLLGPWHSGACANARRLRRRDRR